MSLRAAALNGGTGSSSGAAFPGYISGNWYEPYMTGPWQAGNTGANTNLTLVLQYFPASVTVSELGARVTTGSAGNAMLGLYAHNPATGKPTGLALASVTGISTASAGQISGVLGTPVAFAPGFYWAASQMDNAVAIFGAQPLNGILMNSMIGSAVSLQNVSFGGVIGWQVANTYGTFPDLTAASFGSPADAKVGAMIFHRVA